MPPDFTCANLSAYFSLEETDTSSLRLDAKGTNDLTCVNSAAATTGIIGNGASYSGTHYLRGASTADVTMDGNVPFSLATWFSLPNTSAGWPIIWKGNGVSTLADYEYRVQTNGDKILFAVTDGSVVAGGGGHQGFFTTATAAWSVSTLTFLAAWYDLSNLWVSLNDGTPESVAYTWGSWNASKFLGIGGVGGGGAQFPSGGVMDEVSVWRNYAFAANDITALYNAGSGYGYSSICGGLVPAQDMRGGMQRGLRGGFLN